MEATDRPRREILLELALDGFVLANLAFLVVDIYVAHSVNAFAHPAEWVPFWFSAIAALLLGVGLAVRSAHRKVWRVLGLGVGWLSLGIGFVGLLFHLESQFFALWTLAALVYTAPFAAPLSYCGLGLLLLLNRIERPGSETWSAWVVFLGLGGFLGNLALSLADHAQNGFFQATEWIPVASSALAVGFLLVALWERDSPFLKLTLGVLVAQAGVGVLGFVFHGLSIAGGPAESLFDNVVHGAPVFAPLLFANLALLSGLGVWTLIGSAPALEAPG